MRKASLAMIIQRWRTRERGPASRRLLHSLFVDSASKFAAVRSGLYQATALGMYDNPRHLDDLEVASAHLREIVEVIVAPPRVGRAAQIHVGPVVRHEHAVLLECLQDDLIRWREAGDVEARLEPYAHAHRREVHARLRPRRMPRRSDVRLSRARATEAQ